jgi:arginine N-succinyltransferase
MLIGLEPQRFAEMVLAELRGWFDEDGGCPFWDHVASKFFRLEFDEADMMSASTDGQFILDLAPRHPIYAELLPRGGLGDHRPSASRGRGGAGHAGDRGLPLLRA